MLMLRCTCFVLMILFQALNLHAVTAKLSGTLSNQQIQMNLSFDGRDIIGTYSRGKAPESFQVGGTIKKNNEVLLVEYDLQNRWQGLFHGRISGNTIEGTWTSADGRASSFFTLSGSIAGWKRAPLTDQVSGQYRFGNQLEDYENPEGGVIDIQLLDAAHAKLQGKAYGLVIADPEKGEFRVDIAEIPGSQKAEIKNGVLFYSDEGCTVSIRFQEDSLELTEETGCGGINASFLGTYERVGPPVFSAPPLDPH